MGRERGVRALAPVYPTLVGYTPSPLKGGGKEIVNSFGVHEETGIGIPVSTTPPQGVWFNPPLWGVVSFPPPFKGEGTS